MFEKKIETSAMHNRGGFPVRNVLYAVSAMVFLYVMYLYNGSQNLLHDSELSVARYRREASDRVNEIQELIKSKDQMQESCKDERHESATRFNSLKQQHSMLQSQFKETEADFLKLKTDMETMKSEYQQAESQHATEYQQLKQQKEMEISDLKDKLANSNQHNEELSKSISTLQQQVQSLQSSQQQLQQSNLGLQQQLQTQKLLVQQSALQAVQQHANQDNQVQNMKIQPPQNNQSIDNKLVPQLGQLNLSLGQFNPNPNPGLPADRNNDALAKEIEKAVPRIDEVNAQHQVLPPSNEEVVAKDSNAKDTVELGENVKPNDQQMAQIQEPNLGDTEHGGEGGGEAGVAGVDTGDVEEQRADRAQQEEDGALEKEEKPLDNLALGQMDEPNVGKQDTNMEDSIKDRDDQYVDEGDDIQGQDDRLEEEEEEEEEEEDEDSLLDEKLQAHIQGDNYLGDNRRQDYR